MATKKAKNSKTKKKKPSPAKQDNKPVKKLNNEEARRHLLTVRAADDPDFWDERKVEAIIEESKQETREEMDNVMMTLGFDNDHSLIYTVSEKYRGLVIELRRKMIKDFDCKTHAEKALVDMAVSGYMRVLRSSQAFTRCLDLNEANQNLNQFMANMSKETDRAHRHFLSAYQTLVQLKQPSINVNVKTKNAFVAQAQQFNTTKDDTPAEEIISHK